MSPEKGNDIEIDKETRREIKEELPGVEIIELKFNAIIHSLKKDSSYQPILKGVAKIKQSTIEAIKLSQNRD